MSINSNYTLLSLSEDALFKILSNFNTNQLVKTTTVSKFFHKFINDKMENFDIKKELSQKLTNIYKIDLEKESQQVLQSVLKSLLVSSTLEKGVSFKNEEFQQDVVEPVVTLMLQKTSCLFTQEIEQFKISELMGFMHLLSTDVGKKFMWLNLQMGRIQKDCRKDPEFVSLVLERLNNFNKKILDNLNQEDSL